VAAERLAVSRTVVSKRIVALERSLGTRLLNRNTRQISLTEAGLIFYQHCARVMAELEQAEFNVGRLHSAPRGTLRITAPVTFGRLHVVPAMAGFLAHYKELGVEIMLDDRDMDLVQEGYDLAIRITTTPGPTIVARRLCPIRWVLCASAEYLKQAGTPECPDALTEHNCLFYPYLMADDEWPFLVGGREVKVTVRGNIAVNSSESLRDIALAGLGIVRVPTFAVYCELAAGQLIRVLPAIDQPESGLLAIYASNRHVPPKVRALIDFLVDKFPPNPHWDIFP